MRLYAARLLIIITLNFSALCDFDKAVQDIVHK